MRNPDYMKNTAASMVAYLAEKGASFEDVFAAMLAAYPEDAADLRQTAAARIQSLVEAAVDNAGAFDHDDVRQVVDSII